MKWERHTRGKKGIGVYKRRRECLHAPHHSNIHIGWEKPYERGGEDIIRYIERIAYDKRKTCV
jgi:hypothetical protein